MNRPLRWIRWIQSFCEFTHGIVHDTPISNPFLHIFPSSVILQSRCIPGLHWERDFLTSDARLSARFPIYTATAATASAHVCTCLHTALLRMPWCDVSICFNHLISFCSLKLRAESWVKLSEAEWLFNMVVSVGDVGLTIGIGSCDVSTFTTIEASQSHNANQKKMKCGFSHNNVETQMNFPRFFAV